MERELYVIAHNLRSTHNVGSLLRTAEGLGVRTVFLTGYTPYPKLAQDTRLPHLADKVDARIRKTALGAESLQAFEYHESLEEVLRTLESRGVTVAALELTPEAISLAEFQPPDKIALLLGSEVEGIDKNLLERVPLHLRIPMYGKKESFNVVQAAAMALYGLRFS